MNNVVRSLSATGRPHVNAVSEAFFSLMKKEELYRIKYRSEHELRESINEYIHFYNSERLHSMLAYKTQDWVADMYSGLSALLTMIASWYSWPMEPVYAGGDT